MEPGLRMTGGTSAAKTGAGETPEAQEREMRKHMGIPTERYSRITNKIFLYIFWRFARNECLFRRYIERKWYLYADISRLWQ